MDRPKSDHFRLLCDVGDLIASLEASVNTAGVLQEIARLISRRLHADACLVYLHDDRRLELELSAHSAGDGHAVLEPIRCEPGQGMVGTAFTESRSITQADSLPAGTPDLPGVARRAYRSFAAVPIVRGAERVGVVLIRRARPGGFSDGARRALRATAAQLAGVVANVRLLLESAGNSPEAELAASLQPHVMFEGEVVSNGVAVGPASLLGTSRLARLLSLPAFSRCYSEQDLDRAFERTTRQLEELQKRIGERLTEATALIFDAHLLMLRDSAMVAAVRDGIAAGQNASQAFLEVCRGYMDTFSSSAHYYVREKVRDIEDVAYRVLSNLIGTSTTNDPAWPKCVIITDDLFPSDMLVFSAGDVAGVVTSSGGMTAHVSILARALGIPMVIADAVELFTIPEGTLVLLDGESGSVHVNPPSAIVGRAREHVPPSDALLRTRSVEKSGEARTSDGVRVRLMANINLLAEAPLAVRMGADGIGLYRSELPFLIRTSLPSEQEQVFIYRQLLSSMPGKEITIRTLDVGADKLLPYFDTGNEENPALGLRSLRFCFRHPDVLKKQVRAILRAGAEGEPPRILFPMVCSPDELNWARGMVRESIAGLESDGLPHHSSPLIGAMVEIPAAVEVIDELAEAADFLSLGTNDLTQYMLAVDRGNALVSEHFRPQHPAVLRAVKRVADAAKRHGKALSVCGEMANREPFLSFLIGIGIDSLSVAPQHIPRVRQAIRQISVAEAARRADTMIKTGAPQPDPGPVLFGNS